MQDLEVRIAALERSNRRLRQALLVLALTAVALVTLAMGGDDAGTESTLESLRVRSLDVINEHGQIVVHLGVRSSGAGGFWLTDAHGKRVVHLNQNARGAGRVAVSNAEGQLVAELSAGADGQGNLQLEHD